MSSKIILIVSIIILFASNVKFVYHYLIIKDNNHSENHRLYLTPFIEDGKLDEARKLAVVNHEEMFGVESYSGYLTVNKQYNSNLFFWFFPSEIDPENAPIILWLQGGPGSSSIWGLFNVNGPFRLLSNKTLAKIEYSYRKNHNLIYIDSPVGTGYSFTENDQGYIKTESKIYEHLYSALLQFYHLFPELQGNPLFLSGECYSGKFLPALAYMIHQKNPTAKLKINLKGLAIGNAWIDPINQINIGDHLYQIGLLDLNSWNHFHMHEEKIKSLILKNELSKAAKLFDELIFDSPSVLSNLTGYKRYLFNYIHINGKDNTDILDEWIQRLDVRAAIHVDNDTPFKTTNNTITKYLQHEFMTSEADKVATLLPYYKIMFYSGQLDMIIPFTSIEKVLLNLKWEGIDGFREAQRSIWWSGDDLAGYIKTADNLSLILIRNAGHAVGIEQPKWIFEMITRFTHN